MAWKLFFGRPIKVNPEQRTRLQVERLEDRTVPSTVVALTTSNKLLMFDTASPAVITHQAKITGLSDGTELILGIDFRPATGLLFGISSKSLLYTINRTTGRATHVGSTLNPPMNGAGFGVDFDPVNDQLRLTSDTAQNLRIDPNTGVATGETALAYASGDISFGKTPRIVGAAYNHDLPGMTQTTLFDIDWKRGTLVMQGGTDGTPSPDGGQLSTVGSLGVVTTSSVGFEIDPSGNAWASLTQPNKTTSKLYRVDLTTGAATPVGKIGGEKIVRDLAVVLNGETIYAVTSTNDLVQFNSDTPGIIDSIKPILGLMLNEHIVGIDTRPSTGQLYGMGFGDNAGRIYTINIATGQATQVGNAPFSTTLTGTSFGFDFAPVVDRIRIVSNAEENMRVDPVQGFLINNDFALHPEGEVTALAFDRSFAGTSTATLFGIDTGSNSLVRQGGVDEFPTPSDGEITTIGPLGIDPTSAAGFDIGTGSNTAFAALTVGTKPGLYGINLTTGAATLIGVIGDGTLAIRGMAVATPTVQFSSPTFTATEDAASAEVIVSRIGSSRGVITVNFATSDGTATGGSDFHQMNQTVMFADGETQKKILIQLFPDTKLEGNESVNLTLSSQTGAVVLGGQSTAVLTLLDDD